MAQSWRVFAKRKNWDILGLEDSDSDVISMYICMYQLRLSACGCFVEGHVRLWCRGAGVWKLVRINVVGGGWVNRNI